MNNPSKNSANSFDNHFSFLLCAYMLSSLFIVFVGHLFISERKKANLKEAGIAFFKAIEKEKKQYITTFVFQYDSRLSPNTISGEEKRNWYEQICLISDDPNRHHLDSIFQAELDNRKIRGSVAIQCAVGDKVTISRPEAFYRKATALDAVSYRKNLDAGQKIILQPYVHLPYRWLAGCWPVYMLVAVWLSGTALFIYIVRKKHRRSHLAASIDVEQIVEKMHEPQIKIQWTLLPGNISFDEEHGILKQDDKEVSLSGDSLLYFRHFIQNESFMLTYHDILVYVYGIKTDEISKNDRSRISHGIERLQKQLEGFENLKIILVRGKGYRMEVSTDND